MHEVEADLGPITLLVAVSGMHPRTPSTVRPWIVAATVGLVLTLAGVFWLTGREPTEELASPDPEPTSTTAVLAAAVPDECDATIEDEAFVPPNGITPTRADGKVWYGTDELWTAIPANGISDFEKSVWWSSNFPGSAEEPSPEIEVTYRLLGDETETITNSNVIVATTPDEGSFMSVGFQPAFQGCWEVTATYKDATLTYVYYSAEGQSLTVVVPDLVGMTVGDSFQEFTGTELHVSFAADPGSLEETREAMGKQICNQRPQAGETVTRGTTVLITIAEEDGTCLDLSSHIEVPDVVGLAIDPATLRLAEVDLSSAIYGRGGPTALVCSQDPAAGTLVGPGQAITLQVSGAGGCEELLNPNGLYSRTYVDDEGYEWFGTDCPSADVLIQGGRGDGLPNAGDTVKERVDRLLEESGLELAAPGVVSFRALPRSGKVLDTTENGDVVVLDSEDDYMIKMIIDETFDCPEERVFWNGIPVAFVLVDSN